MSNEIWKDIDGYGGKYRISNMGRILSYAKKKEGVILTPCDNGNGYQYISLGRGSENRRYIHRLVCEAFLPNPNNLPEVNHKDEDRTNNCVNNLEWCDRIYNINYGTHNDKHCKSINQYTVDGIFIKTWRSIKDAEKFYHVNHIWECCVGKRKTCGGFTWKYNGINKGYIC